MSTPVLDLELDRFGRDLLAAAAREPARTRLPTLRMPSRRVAILVVLALLVGVPAAIAAIDAIFFGNDQPHVQPPPGFEVPGITSSPVQVATGSATGGTWRAFAVRCGTGTTARVSVVVVSPFGNRNSAACGAVAGGGGRVAPAFTPALFYDGATTFVYAAVPARVARVALELEGPGQGHYEAKPVDVAEARTAVGMDVRFVVVAVPGDQRLDSAEALDASGNVIARCSEGRCEDVQ